MPFLDDTVLDSGLSALSAVTGTLHICHTAPVNRAQAISYSVANKTGVTPGAPAARTPSGRKVTIPLITGGAVTATSSSAADDAEFWAFIDGTKLWVAGGLASGQMVTNGNSFSTTAAIDIGMPGV